MLDRFSGLERILRESLSSGVHFKGVRFGGHVAQNKLNVLARGCCALISLIT